MTFTFFFAPSLRSGEGGGGRGVHIYIPVWKNLSGVKKCLAAIARTTADLPCTVTLIDDGNTASISRRLTCLGRTLKYRTNRGFTASINTARKDFLERAEPGDFFVLLNSDTIPQKNWLMELLKAVKKYPDTGIFSAQLLSPKDHLLVVGGGTRPVLQKNGGFIPLNFFVRRGRSRDFKRDAVNPWAEFAAVLITYACLKNVGSFNEHLKHFGSDVEFCYRAREKKLLTRYITSSRIIHTRHESLDQNPPAMILKMLRTDLIILKKILSK
jgi:GT2 family glycosyltransferase